MQDGLLRVKARTRLVPVGALLLLLAAVAAAAPPDTPPGDAGSGHPPGDVGTGDPVGDRGTGEPGPGFTLPTPIGDVVYAPGRGIRFGDTGLWLGGYANANVTRDEGGPGTFGIDDLSFFVGWNPHPRVHLFSELELEDLLTVDDEGHTSTDYLFTVERLYADVTASDALAVRVGKFLTPVGRWNEIHAQPLVWTTSRPLATVLPFDRHVTGAMVYGALFPSLGQVGWSLYGQATNQFEPVDEVTPADRSVGGRVELTPGTWSVGASVFASAHHGAWRTLGGVDGAWHDGPWEALGEAVYADGDGGREWGFYLQLVRELFAHIYAVGRFEHYDQRRPLPAANLMIAGAAWRPVPWLTFKLEYLAADHRTDESPPGFKSSLAILF